MLVGLDGPPAGGPLALEARVKARTILFGPPGTGKTTTLMEKVRWHLAQGTPPERIGFVSFSRRALEEAKAKLKDVAGEGDFLHFRTIHATAFHLLGLSRNDVLQPEHLRDFGEQVGVQFGAAGDQALWEGSQGDRIMALHHLAAARDTSLEHEWRHADLPDLPWVEVQRTTALYERFKKAHALWDFTDMIAQAEGTLDVDVLFVDEAQDTSTAQWALLQRIAAHVPHVYIAGDDDQAVYHWSGADPLMMLRFKGTRHVLPQSYRLPGEVKALADQVIQRIRLRVPKEFQARDEQGTVRWVSDIEMVDLHQKESWLLLARSNYQLRELRQLARQQGVVYSLSDGRWSWSLPSVQAAISYERLRKGHQITKAQARYILSFLPTPLTPPHREHYVWDEMMPEEANRELTWMDALSGMALRDREYVRALRRTGESLTKPGRVRIGTVHSVKGAEADHVLLVTDVSERVARTQETDPDAEARVQYVGVTRARESLTLIQPKSNNYWSF